MARMRLFSWGRKANIEVDFASLPAITHENPLRQAKSLKTKSLIMAERVGFVPAEPTCLKGLGQIGTARNRHIL